MMKFMTEEEKAKREKEFQAVLKGIEVATAGEDDLFYNVSGSSKYKYRRGAWKDYYKAVLDAQNFKDVDYNECRRKRCDGKKKEEIFGVHLYKLGDRETTDNIWIALACQTSNNGGGDENFALKKDTIIVKFTTNKLVTRIEKDM